VIDLLALVDQAGAGQRDEKVFEQSIVTQVASSSVSYLGGVTPPYVATIAYVSPLTSSVKYTRDVIGRMAAIPRVTAGASPVTLVGAKKPATTGATTTTTQAAKPKTGTSARPKTATTRGPPTSANQTPRKPGLPERPKTARPPAKVVAPTTTTGTATTPTPTTTVANGENKKPTAGARVAAKKKAYATLPAGFSPNRTTGSTSTPTIDASALAATRSRPTATGSPAKAAATVRIRAPSPPARPTAGGSGSAAPPGKGAVPPRRGSAFQARPKSATGTASGSSNGIVLRPDLTTVIALRPWNDSKTNDNDYATTPGTGVITTHADGKSSTFRFDHVLQWEEKALTGAPTTRFLRDAVVSGSISYTSIYFHMTDTHDDMHRQGCVGDIIWSKSILPTIIKWLICFFTCLLVRSFLS
jgi:hypothetical protein